MGGLIKLLAMLHSRTAAAFLLGKAITTVLVLSDTLSHSSYPKVRENLSGNLPSCRTMAWWDTALRRKMSPKSASDYGFPFHQPF